MKSYHKRTAITHYILKKIVKPIFKFLWIKDIKGIDNIPKKGAYIFAFNHQSFFDFLIFTSISPRNIHFLAAEKFYNHKLWRPLMILTGQIKVDRHAHDKSDVHENVRIHLEKGLLLGIFPEGTRSPYPDQMLPAFDGISKYALKHRVNVIPVGLRGMHEILPKDGKKISFKKCSEIHIGEPIDLSSYWGNYDDINKCVDVTEKIMKEIEKLSGKKYNHYRHNYAE
jgi:1-acyl-sn-glycerol-3-phosphate acyltransferase